MTETCEKAEKFLAELTGELGFDLEVSSSMTDEGCLLDLLGKDVALAHAENGELLDAFETVLFQVYGRELDREHRIICDAEGFRQTRKAELQAMAKDFPDDWRPLRELHALLRMQGREDEASGPASRRGVRRTRTRPPSPRVSRGRRRQR